MEKLTIRFLACMTFATFLFSACSENSSSAEPEDTFDAAVVCPADGLNAYGEPNRGTFTDARDGQEYKYVTIGSQVWMAENLKFDAPYSKCYDRIDCDVFGRYYSLFADGKWFGYFDQQLLDTICPAGWHVPSLDEWNELTNRMGGTKKANVRLRSSENFGEKYVKGTDDCLFSGLPAGYVMGQQDGLYSEYIYSVYWTSTAASTYAAYAYYLTSISIDVDQNKAKMTIRCLKTPL